MTHQERKWWSFVSSHLGASLSISRLNGSSPVLNDHDRDRSQSITSKALLLHWKFLHDSSQTFSSENANFLIKVNVFIISMLVKMFNHFPQIHWAILFPRHSWQRRKCWPLRFNGKELGYLKGGVGGLSLRTYLGRTSRSWKELQLTWEDGCNGQ